MQVLQTKELLMQVLQTKELLMQGMIPRQYSGALKV